MAKVVRDAAPDLTASWARAVLRLPHAFAVALLVLASCGRADAPAADERATVTTATPRPPSWVSIVVAHSDTATSGDESVAMTLERTASTVDGVTAIRSETDDAHIVVSLAFDVDDTGAAMGAVVDAIAQAQPQLPPGQGVPQVLRRDRDEADAWLLLRSDHVSAIGLAAVAERTIEQLQQQPGVREASACGPRVRMVLELDLQRMAAYGLAIADVRRLLVGDDIITAAIDPAAVMTGVNARTEVLAMHEDTISSCTVIASARGGGVAVHLRYETDQAATLSTHLAGVRSMLPPSIELVHEPLDADRPRVAIRAPALAQLPWREHPRATGAWMIVDEADGTAELVGLADASAARELATALQAVPGVIAMPEDVQWSSVVLLGSELERLSTRAPALSEALARVSPSGVWPEQVAPVPRRNISVDPTRAAALGVARREIDDVLAASSREGLWLARRLGQAHQDVVLRIAGEPEQLLPELRVKATDGMVPLSALVTVTTSLAPIRLSRCDMQRCIGFAIPTEIAASLDLPTLARELGLAPDERLAVLPRAPALRR